MTATASTVRATGLYRRLQHESRAAAADPIELVTMLYDELETAIGVLGSMVRQGQRISATEPAHRARAILIGLDGSPPNTIDVSRDSAQRRRWPA